ncbi:unnamed protein product, partial [Mesorhabditis belari]|uniref:Carboxypeptidase n=1 Tax=Mesorhabditis belari TaxID=2138241 RepID=A0AAF3J4J8_9BILA
MDKFFCVLFVYSTVSTLFAADPKNDKVNHLPGLNFEINYDLYSGYLNAGKNGDWKMHYMLIESKGPKSDDDPILVWLQGGPGCSSFGAIFEELGPFYMSPDGKSLFENKYAWNNRANLLFLESPIGVGFSYDKTNPQFDDANDDQAKEMNYVALSDFFNSYSKYTNRSFFLAGESYSGVYIPMLAARLVQGIANGTFPNPNFQGAAIGNGYLDVARLYNSLVLWSGYHGRVSVQEWDFLKSECTSGMSRMGDMDTYNFFSYLRTTNYLTDFASDNSTCGNLIMRLVTVPDGMDAENYYQDCFDPKWYQSSMEKLDKTLPKHPAKLKRIRRRAAIHEKASFYQSFATSFNYGSTDPFNGYPCWNYVPRWHWVNSLEVKKALNIDESWIDSNYTWFDCNNDMYNKYVMTYIEQYQFFEIFFKINTKKDFRFLIYNGDVDTVCNYLGDAWFVLELAKRNGMSASDRKEWWFAGQTAGYTQRYTHSNGVIVDLVTVKGAGHFVPTDRPGASRQMITNFILPDKDNKPDYNSTTNADPMPTFSPIIETETSKMTESSTTNTASTASLSPSFETTTKMRVN